MSEILPRAAVFKDEGTNCEVETVYALEQAGADADVILSSQFGESDFDLSDYQMLVVPGGFSSGDDIKSGLVMAKQIEVKLGDQVHDFVENGGLGLGICNGFQVFVRSGLLPSGDIYEPQSDITLTDNTSGSFECRWTPIMTEQTNSCLFVPEDFPEYFSLPVAHGEGRFLAISDEKLRKLEENGQIVFRYADKEGNPTEDPAFNPNGSPGGVTGITDPYGQILGLMPHPERAIRTEQDPNWRRYEDPDTEVLPVGRILIQNMVDLVKE